MTIFRRELGNLGDPTEGPILWRILEGMFRFDPYRTLKEKVEAEAKEETRKKLAKATKLAKD